MIGAGESLFHPSPFLISRPTLHNASHHFTIAPSPFPSRWPWFMYLVGYRQKTVPVKRNVYRVHGWPVRNLQAVSSLPVGNPLRGFLVVVFSLPTLQPTLSDYPAGPWANVDGFPPSSAFDAVMKAFVNFVHENNLAHQGSNVWLMRHGRNHSEWSLSLCSLAMTHWRKCPALSITSLPSNP